MTLKNGIFPSLFALALIPSLAHAASTTNWFPFGPDGGDARAFASDPSNRDHLFVGAPNGWIYDSQNAGKEWRRLARVGNRDDLVLDNIVIDPANSKHVLVGAWVLGSADGGLYVTTDGGATWKSNPEMDHESIRALTAAPSNPKLIVAGTLKGVFRSEDGGEHWKLISPAGSNEIHEVESIAIDPVDPKIIYAGTWHLPWKTLDGGVTWNNVKQGIIEDSDVFSIIVDPKQPKVVYLSACSGIYKSEDAGGKFSKIQGIPTTARRTRVLMQDPTHSETVYAGTTEGLFHTEDSGAHWNRTTGADVIINDVYVDPRDSKRVMLATDRGGILTSSDGGLSFSPSNTGFSSRQITSLVADSKDPSHLYLGVVNDKQWGGAFASTDGGLTWVQRQAGLEGHDVFSLGEAANGTWVAGTEHGLYAYDSGTQAWKRTGSIVPPPAPEKPAVRARKRGSVAVSAKAPARSPSRTTKSPASPGQVEVGISALGRVGDQLYAVTSEGAFAADDPTQPWKRVEGPAAEPWRYVASMQSTVLLGSFKALSLSTDSGKAWHSLTLPAALTSIGAVSIDDAGELWVGGREGIFYSVDQGATWATMSNLFVSDVNSLFFDTAGHRLLITANGASKMVFAFHIPGKTLKYWDTGWNLRLVRPVGDHLIGATMYDGIVAQPRMVESKELSSR